MATLDRTVLTPLGSNTRGAAAGQAAGWQPATAAGGDLIPLTGRGVIIRVRTTGTACSAVIDSVAPSNYGGDQDLTMTLADTDEQEVYLDASDARWDQGGANRGYAKVTCSQVVGVSIAAKIVP
ncbi:hypothetical protein [Actinomadura opuntiae]|uniref:hypothetical protein n=1 Tax=Actinomadura sp. OS1-43 TaxID=604315 RepID=UPI00255A7F6B|nr:hypothetical protein [Actinomadura sp. OS1-43]MDL4812812.1 hypothetical protein [Actinomadura sp. OS1-43]